MGIPKEYCRRVYLSEQLWFESEFWSGGASQGATWYDSRYYGVFQEEDSKEEVLEGWKCSELMDGFLM